MKKPNIILDKENPESIEIIAQSIIKVSSAAIQLLNSGLNERALITLLQEASGVKRTEIKNILFYLPKLKDIYCRNNKK